MKIYQRGRDHWGHFYWVKVGKGGLSFRFDTDGIDLVLGLSCSWKDGNINLRVFNFGLTYFFETDWE